MKRIMTAGTLIMVVLLAVSGGAVSCGISNDGEGLTTESTSVDSATGVEVSAEPERSDDANTPDESEPDESETDESETDESASDERASDERASDESAPGYIAALPGEITVPNGYDVWAVDNVTEKSAKKHGLTKEKADLLLSYSKLEIIMIPEDISYADADFKINVRVKENDYGVDNLCDLSKNELKEWAEALMLSFSSAGGGSSDYKIVKADNLVFIKFNFNAASKNLRYATVVNGKMVYIYAEYKDSLTKKQEKTLADVAMSLKY